MHFKHIYFFIWLQYNVCVHACVCVHVCVREANALARLHKCAGSSGLWLLADMIDTKESCDGALIRISLHEKYPGVQINVHNCKLSF